MPKIMYGTAGDTMSTSLYDLEPNKTYVIWVRAVRRSLDLMSGPSDPIIVTTLPDLPIEAEKPTVPVLITIMQEIHI